MSIKKMALAFSLLLAMPSVFAVDSVGVASSVDSSEGEISMSQQIIFGTVTVAVFITACVWLYEKKNQANESNRSLNDIIMEDLKNSPEETMGYLKVFEGFVRDSIKATGGFIKEASNAQKKAEAIVTTVDLAAGAIDGIAKKMNNDEDTKTDLDKS